jgi:long-subunit acyl-CoA synthetase (AMP-forming)
MLTYADAAVAIQSVATDLTAHGIRQGFVRCGSGALDDRLRDELDRVYGVPVIESYGMSEARQVVKRAHPLGDGRAGLQRPNLATLAWVTRLPRGFVSGCSP